MEKKEIIQHFLSKGVMLSPDVLEYLFNNQGEIKNAEKLVSQGKLFLTLSDLKKEIEVKEEKEKMFEIERIEEMKKISIDDLKLCLENRLSFLSSILMKKPELDTLISIGKIKHSTKKFSVIGLVKDKEEGKITLEDKTGVVEVQVDDTIFNSVFVDEVIGLNCYQEDRVITSRKLIKPDIPIFRKIPTTNDKIILTNKSVILKEKHDLEWGDFLRIKVDNFFVFYLSEKILRKYSGSNPLHVLVDLLKGRNFHPTLSLRKKFYKKDPFLLDKIPDIVIIPSHKLVEKTYKGVSLFFLPNNYGIDLSSRKPIKLE